jgi:hypothetical protein
MVNRTRLVRHAALTSIGPRQETWKSFIAENGNQELRSHKFSTPSSSKEASLNNDEILKWSYMEVNSTEAASADRIVCDPTLRKLFIEFVHRRLPDLPEFNALHGLQNLRRRKQLPRLHRV